MNSFPFVDSEGLTNAVYDANSSYNWTFDYATWRLTGVNFGPQLSFNMKRSAVDIRGIAGFLAFFSPELVVHGESQSGGPEAEFKQLKQRTSSWTLGAGLCYKYEITRGIVLLANAEYLVSNPKFTDVNQELYIEGSGLVNSSKVTYYQSFKVFNLQLGCGWVF